MYNIFSVNVTGMNKTEKNFYKLHEGPLMIFKNEEKLRRACMCLYV